jgi:hypothetical protein
MSVMRTREIAALSLSIASVSVAVFANAASAQGFPVETDTERDPNAPLYTSFGIGVVLGGGIESFTNSTATSVTDIAGAWNLRVEVGTDFPISGEASYIGTAQSIDGLFGNENGTLIGTTVQGAVKWNISTGTVARPFLLAGMGWRYYNVTSADFTTAADGIADSDNQIVFPLAAGVRYSRYGFDADVRFTFSPAVSASLIVEPDGDDAAMHTWNLGANVGASF